MDFFIILEQAIVEKMKLAEDIMVRQPAVAETWHLIAHVRQTMLANSFSTLPVLIENRWCLIADLMVMQYLRSAPNNSERNVRLSTQLAAAIQNGGISPVAAMCVLPQTLLTNVTNAMSQGLVLITESDPINPRLVGILSAFDLM